MTSSNETLKPTKEEQSTRGQTNHAITTKEDEPTLSHLTYKVAGMKEQRVIATVTAPSFSTRARTPHARAYEAGEEDEEGAEEADALPNGTQPASSPGHYGAP